ncbi:hypothetical protein FQZ97_587590 [compost metagenome]
MPGKSLTIPAGFLCCSIKPGCRKRIQAGIASGGFQHIFQPAFRIVCCIAQIFDFADILDKAQALDES